MESSMRINVYAEEMTNRVEIVEKNGHTGLRIYLELPVTLVPDREAGGFKRKATVEDKKENLQQFQGPFVHHTGDDDSAAVTFWGKRELLVTLKKAVLALENFYKLREAKDLYERAANGDAEALKEIGAVFGDAAT
jgi:hypothetical protein